MEIKSFAEAKQIVSDVKGSIAALDEFIGKLERTISAIDTLRGNNQETVEMSRGNGIPDTWQERVIRIFEDSQKPLMQRDVVRIYQDRGWPPPEKGKLYTVISGAIAYLHKKKDILKKSDDGYTLNK